MNESTNLVTDIRPISANVLESVSVATKSSSSPHISSFTMYEIENRFLINNLCFLFAAQSQQQLFTTEYIHKHTTT